jgi:hypothetical protein
MSPTQKTYVVEVPCYVKPIKVRWRDGVDVCQFAQQILVWVRELLEALKDSIDPYAEEGAEYLSVYAEELETWVPQLPSEQAMERVTPTIFVLRGLWEEIDRVEETEICSLIQRISFDAQEVIERL